MSTARKYCEQAGLILVSLFLFNQSLEKDNSPTALYYIYNTVQPKIYAPFFYTEMLVRYHHSRFDVSDSKAVASHSVDRNEIKLFVMLNEV